MFPITQQKPYDATAFPLQGYGERHSQLPFPIPLQEINMQSWENIFFNLHSFFIVIITILPKKSDNVPLLSCGESVRMYIYCVVALTPDDKADQKVPRDKSGAQAPKIILAPSR